MSEETTKNKLIDLIDTYVWTKQGFNDLQKNTQRMSLERMSLEQLEKVVKRQMSYMDGVNVEEELSNILGGNNNSSNNKNSNNTESGEGISLKEVKTLLESLVEKKFDGKFTELEKKLFKMIANDLPTFKIQMGNKAAAKNTGLAHRLYPKLLALAATRTAAGDPLNIWLTGPAGSGKTKAAENVAKELGLDFYFNGAIDTEYKLLGFVDAKGQLVNTAFRKAYTEGGVYLFDEVDASLPGALLAFNAALANGYADFPDGKHERHPDCIIIAAANTWGTGPNAEYVGRNKLDAAFIDRFVQLAWDYDKNLEKALAGCDEWVEYVQSIRENLLNKHIKAVISPRASITGAALLNSGNFSVEDVVAMTLKKGTSEANWDNMTAGISNVRLKKWHENLMQELQEKFQAEDKPKKKPKLS